MGGKKFHGTYSQAIEAISPIVDPVLFQPKELNPVKAIETDLPRDHFVVSSRKKRIDFESAWREGALNRKDYVQGDMTADSIGLFRELLFQEAVAVINSKQRKLKLSRMEDEPEKYTQDSGFKVNFSFAYCDDEGNYCGFRLTTSEVDPNYWEVTVIRKATEPRESRDVTILLNLGEQDVNENILKTQGEMGPIQEELKTALNSVQVYQLLSPLFKEDGFINTEACRRLKEQVYVKNYLDMRLNKLLKILQEAQRKVNNLNGELISELANEIETEQNTAEQDLSYFLASLNETAVNLKLESFYNRVQGLRNVESIVERNTPVYLNDEDFLSEREIEFRNSPFFEVILNLSFTDKNIASMRVESSSLRGQLIQITQTNAENSRKKILAQLTFDLHQLDLLDSSYEIFCNESDEFLKFFHRILSTNSNSEELLKEWLSPTNSSQLGVLRLISEVKNSDKLFTDILNSGKLDQIRIIFSHYFDHPDRLKINKSHIAPLINVILKRPDIHFPKLIPCFEFLHKISGTSVNTDKLTDFLLANLEDKKTLEETAYALIRINESNIGAAKNEAMALILAEAGNDLRAILNQANCELIIRDDVPAEQTLRKGATYKYILTRDKLFYFDSSKDENKLQEIVLQCAQLEKLRTQFIDRGNLVPLSRKDLEKITEIAGHPHQGYLAYFTELAIYLKEIGRLDLYETLKEEPKLVVAFNQLYKDPSNQVSHESVRHFLKGFLQNVTLDQVVNQCKSVVENKRLKALLACRIVPPTDDKIYQLLSDTSYSSKAMDYLLSLNLQNPKARELAYKLASLDNSSEATNFRLMLEDLEKNKDKFKESVQKNIIETLCLTQIALKERSGEDNTKDIFALFNSKEAKNGRFQEAIYLIENKCHDIRTRLNTKDTKKQKITSFIGQEQKYRQNLYTLAFDAVTKKMRPSKFAERIKESSKEMLKVVDEDRHPWCRNALFALANLLGSCLLMIPNIVKGVTSKISGAKALFFYSTTQSGKDIRELHNDLTDTLSKKVIR
ncbi:hypothetical protein [Legionella gresilensis]|uniref:hypothetical protein n=1 Tax=Legionella gresilensis TaxID=91823 RepID=UPI0010411B5D|nr:hypothetical protein [Legionella gresilensis]